MMILINIYHLVASGIFSADCHMSSHSIAGESNGETLIGNPWHSSWDDWINSACRHDGTWRPRGEKARMLRMDRSMIV